MEEPLPVTALCDYQQKEVRSKHKPFFNGVRNQGWIQDFGKGGGGGGGSG